MGTFSPRSAVKARGPKLVHIYLGGRGIHLGSDKTTEESAVPASAYLGEGGKETPFVQVRVYLGEGFSESPVVALE